MEIGWLRVLSFQLCIVLIRLPRRWDCVSTELQHQETHERWQDQGQKCRIRSRETLRLPASGGEGQRKRSAMRRHRLRTETETQPAHSLQQKLGVVFLYLMFVSLATQIGRSRDDPPSSRKQSRPVKIIARPTMCSSKIIVTHAPY